MYIKSQTFLVLGVSQSGFAAADYILDNGGRCFLVEELDIPKTKKAIADLREKGAIHLSREEALNRLAEIDVVVISPGIPINYDVAVQAKKLGKRIVGELEFGFLQFSPLTIGITGTNGKTTTVSLIDHVLKAAGMNSKAVGNIGVPISSQISNFENGTVFVAEVSSFQLETVNFFCPHIACVLNISPDHLDRHYTMENYIYLKKRILSSLRESEYAVLNFDDQTVRDFRTETRAKLIWVSLKEKVDGCYIEEGKIFYKQEYITDIDKLSLGGEHNIYNAMFAVAVGKLCGISTKDIALALGNFKGVANRMELIAERSGVKYINDSKATNTASCITAIKSLRNPTVLILGGSEKGETYDKLFEAVKEAPIKQVVLTGASRFNMLESAGRANVNDISLTGNFEFAVKIASMFADSGDIVLLSPACASFDNFSNFEERGQVFKRVVESLS